MAREPLRFTPPDDVPRMKPFCHACQANPAHGYCLLKGCPMRPGRDDAGAPPAPRTPEDGQTVHTPEQGRPVTTRRTDR